MGRKRTREGKHLHLFLACLILSVILGCGGLQGLLAKPDTWQADEPLAGDQPALPENGRRRSFQDRLHPGPPAQPEEGLRQGPGDIPAARRRASPQCAPRAGRRLHCDPRGAGGPGKGAGEPRKGTGEPRKGGAGPEAAGRRARKAGRRPAEADRTAKEKAPEGRYF